MFYRGGGDSGNSNKEDASAYRTALKGSIGAWMFVMLTSFNREEFVHLVKTMHTDPDLAEFKSGCEAALKNYQKFYYMCTTKQVPYAGKPFFYGITHNESLDGTASTVHYEIDCFTTREADVTEKLRTAQQFGAFGNTLANYLQNNNRQAVDQVNKSIVNKYSTVDKALLKCGYHFADLAAKRAKAREEYEKKMAEYKSKLAQEEEEDGECGKASDVDEDDQLDLHAPLKSSSAPTNKKKAADVITPPGAKTSIYKEAISAKVVEEMQYNGATDEYVRQASKRVAEAMERATKGFNMRKRL